MYTLLSCSCRLLDFQHLHKVKIWTASMKNRKLSSYFEIKLTVNHPDFDYICEPKINNLKSKWSRELVQAQVPTTAFINAERNLLPEIKFKQTQTMSRKRFFFQVNKKWHWIQSSTMWSVDKQSALQIITTICTRKNSKR